MVEEGCMTKEQQERCETVEKIMIEALEKYALTFIVEASTGLFLLVPNEDLDDKPRLH